MTEQELAIKWFESKNIPTHIINENVYLRVGAESETNILVAPSEVSYRADLQRQKEHETTREDMVMELMEKDIRDIKINFESGYTDFIYAVLSGIGWTQYKNLTDEEVEVEYTDMKENQDETNL